MRSRCWLAVAAVLSACSAVPTAPSPQQTAVMLSPPALERFQLQGRVALRSGEKQFSGGLSWQVAPEDETLLLSTPLGQGVAQLQRLPQGVELLDTDGKRHVAADAETLVRQVTGLELPLAGLSAWVSGAARAGSPYVAYADADGRVGELDQDGWHIGFSRYAEHAVRWLPGKVVARRGDDLEVKLVVDTWTLP